MDGAEVTTIFLYVIFARHFAQRIQFPSWADCFAALRTARYEIPNGAENETGVVMFCGTASAEFRGADEGWVVTERVKP